MGKATFIFFFALLVIAYAQPGSSGTTAEDAEEPVQAFTIFRKLARFDDFIMEQQHPSLVNFTSVQRQDELLEFSDSLEAHPEKKGFLFHYMKAAEELGIFKILHEANLCSVKEIPVIRCGDGFIEEYCQDALRMLCLAKFCNYAVMFYYETGEYGKSIQLLDDLINIERVVTVHATTWRVLEIISKDNGRNQKYTDKLLELKELFQQGKEIQRAQLHPENHD